MSFNGSGTFQINSAGQPVVTGTVISSTAFNALTADLATGLSTCVTKDGQTNPTANLPMAGYKLTGLGTGSASTDSATLGQVQSNTVSLIGSISGTNTITGSLSPAIAAYAAGQMFWFVAAGANTGATTININSLGAKSITKNGTTALAANDIKSGQTVVIVYDGTQFQLIGSSLAGITTSAVTALGINAGDSVTSGTANTAVGYDAGTAITTGSNNTLIGNAAGAAITSLGGNTLIGDDAGSQYNFNFNTFIGQISGRNMNSSYNVGVGRLACRGVGGATGGNNTAIGAESLSDLTTGSNNTGLGYGTGTTITTGSGNTLVGKSAQTGSASASNRIVIGQGVTGTADNRITIGSGANIAELDLDGSDTSWSASSDERLKENIQPSDIGLALIASLRPVTYQWKKCKDIDPAVPGYVPEYDDEGKYNPQSDERVHGDGDSVYHGFIAQESEAAIAANGADVMRMVKQREDGIYTVAPGTLIPALVKAIQELKADFDAYKASHP